MIMRRRLLTLFITFIIIPQATFFGKTYIVKSYSYYVIGKDKDVVSLKGKLINFHGDITYLMDVSDKAGLRVPENILIEPDSSGKFQIKFSIKEPGYYKLEENTLYLSPGDNLIVEINCLDKSKAKFSGRGSEACSYLKTIPDFSQVDIGYLGKNYENVMKDINQFISEYMLPRAEKSLSEINKLKNVTKEFKELETARIKSDVIMSIMLYTAGYTAKFVEGYNVQRDRNLFSKLHEEHINTAREILMKYGEGLARADNIVLPEFRKILAWIRNSNGKDLPKYNKIDRIEDYEQTASLLQQYDYCFTSYPNDRKKKEDVLSELEAAKEKMSTQLYKELIDKSIKEHEIIRKGAPVFDFTGYDVNGNPVKLSDFKGKYIYLDFWATWCGPCNKEYPFFQELYHKFKDREDIVFLSVSTDQDKDRWLQYMKNHNHETISIHVSNSMLNPYKIAFIPRFILINKDFTFYDPSAPRPSQPEAEIMLSNLK